jgi:hypothetical protein
MKRMKQICGWPDYKQYLNGFAKSIDLKEAIFGISRVNFEV